METKKVNESLDELFDEYSKKFKKVLDATSNKELAEKRIAYVLCKMDNKDTDITFSGGIEHAARAICGILRVFTKSEATTIMQCVVEVMLASLFKEDMENIIPSPVSPNKSKLKN